jgi:hypothetical protein
MTASLQHCRRCGTQSTWSLDRLIDADRFNNDALSCACRRGARNGDLLRRAMKAWNGV